MGARDFKISITWQIGNTAAVSSGISQVNSALTGINGAANTAAGGMNTFGSSVQGTLPAVKGQSEAAQKAVGAHSAMAGAVGKNSNALSGFNTSVGNASKTLPGLTAAQQGASTSNSDLAARTAKTTQSMVAMGSRVGGLAFLFGGLVAAMGESQGTQEALEVQQKKLNEAQAEAREVIERYGAGSVQAAEALKEVESAERSVAFAGRIARLSYQDQLFFILVLASQGIEPAIKAYGGLRNAQAAAAAAGVPLLTQLRNQGGILGRLAGAFTGLGSAIGISTDKSRALSPALNSVGITSTSARNASTGLTGALAGVGKNLDTTAKNASGARGAFGRLTGAFGGTTGAMAAGAGIMLGVGAAIAIISTNTFGARTALDNFGKSVGDANPVLAVLFEGIRDVAEAMGIVESNGRTAGDAMAHLDEVNRKNSESLAEVTTGWQLLVQAITENPLTQAIISGLATIGTEIANVFSNIGSQVNTALQTIAGFIHSNIVVPILDIPNQITSIGQSIVNTIKLGWEAVTGFVQTFIISPILAIPQNISNIGQSIVNTIKLGWEAIVGFVQTLIADPIRNVPTLIATVGQSIVNVIVQGWTTFVTLVKSNIVDPILGVPTFLTSLGQNILDAIIQGWNTFTSLIQTNLVEPILDIPDFLSSLGQNIVDAIITGWNTFVNVVQQNLVQPILDIPNHIGNLGQLILDGITFGWDSFTDILQQNLVQPIIDFADTIETTSKNNGSLIDGLRTAFENLINPVKAAGDEGKAMGDKTEEGAKKATEATKSMEQVVADLLQESQKSKEELATMFIEYLSGTTAAQRATVGIADVMSVYEGKVRATEAQQKLLVQAQKAYDAAIAEGKTDREAMIEALASIGISFGVTGTEAGKAAPAVEKVTNAMTSLSDSVASGAKDLEAYRQALADGSFEAAKFAEGQQEAELVLVELFGEIQNAKGQLDFYSDGLAIAVRNTLEFQAGAAEATLALIEERGELERAKGSLEAFNDEQNRASAESNAALKGWVEQSQAIQEASLAYFEAAGRLERLRQSLSDVTGEVERVNTGVLTGAANAIEWYQEIDTARGEAGGFHEMLVKLATKLDSDLPNAMGMSTEQLQRFIGVMRGAPDAIQEVIDGVGEMAQTIIDRLSKAGEEGKNAFLENLAELENQLRTQFSEPVVRAIELAVNLDGVEKQAEAALGTMATIIEGSIIPGPTIQFDTATIQQGARELMAGLEEVIAASGPRVAAKLQPVMDVLQRIANTNFNTAPISEVGSILNQILTSSENLSQSGLQPLLGLLGQVPSISAAGAEGFAALDRAIAGTGFSVDSLGNVIRDSTGEIVGNLTTMADSSEEQLSKLGPAADAARVAWVQQIGLMNETLAAFTQKSMELIIVQIDNWKFWGEEVHTSLSNVISDLAKFGDQFLSSFGDEISNHLETAASHFDTFATNVHGSLETVVSDLAKFGDSFLPAFASSVGSSMRAAASHFSSFASSVSSNMSRLRSSVASATSAVKQLQSAINSLRSRTITITIIRRFITIGSPFAFQHGGSFVVDKPTMIAGKQIGEFSKPELVTVTPLSNPSDITDKTTTINTSAVSRAVNADTRAGSKKGGLKKEVLEPIFITIDGEVIMKLVQKRLLEFAADNII